MRDSAYIKRERPHKRSEHACIKTRRAIMSGLFTRVQSLQGDVVQLEQPQTLQALRSISDFLNRNELNTRLRPLAPHIKTHGTGIERLEEHRIEL